MKKIYLIIICALFAVPSNGYAWWWSSEPAKEVIVADPVLEIQMMARASTFNKLVKETLHEEFVLCSDCPEGMPLEREMAEVSVVIRMSAEPPVIERVAKADPIATRPEVAVPSSSALVDPVIDSGPPIAPDSSPEKVPQQVALEQPLQEKSSPGPCLSPPIQFALDKAVITSSELDRIKSVEDLLRKSKNIEVRGYTCSLGSKSHNDTLAMKRASAVADVLKQMGITPTSVTSEGKCCYVSEDKAQNRRVEITCVQNP